MEEEHICQQLVDIPSTDEQEPCGEPARFKIRIKGRAAQAEVWLCKAHKNVHDHTFATLRARNRHSA